VDGELLYAPLCSLKSDFLTRMKHTGNTLRDWDYMSEKHNAEIEKDPFKLVSSQTRDACIMEDADLFSKAASLWGTEYDPLRKQRVPDDYEAPALVGGSRGSTKERREAELFALRLWFSLLGGLALIAPMLFMVLYKGGEHVSLITTSVSTILFAVAMAKFSTQPPWNLVATTAAYAAVLVVFVGSSSPSAA